MNIANVIQKIDKLIQDVTHITAGAYSQTPEQLDEHLKSWEARAYEEIGDCGLTDAAERFAKTSHRTRVNNYQGNLLNKADAKKANLTALLADMKSNSDFYEGKLRKRFATQPAGGVTGEDEGKLLVLISHSSKDQVLASALIDLLRSGLGLLPNQIRCSSVDGYRLPAGVNTDTQLRSEVRASRVLIGLITPNSLASPYVLFELGARWGAGEVMIPLLAGVTAERLRGPISGMNALLCNSDAQLHQALAETGAHLGVTVQSPAAYLKQLRSVVEEANRQAPVNNPELVRNNASPIERDSQIAALKAEVTTLRRKPYEEDLEKQCANLIDRLSPQGKILLRHLVANEPIEVGRRFKPDIPQDVQDAQLSLAYGSGIVRHNEVRAGTGMLIRTDYVVNPQFRPVLQDLLYKEG